MSDASYVEEASQWADALAWHDCKRPGDYLNAMHRVAAQIKLNYATLWALRYRKPKTVTAGTYFGLKQAYDDMRLTQLHALEADLALSRHAGVAQHLLDAAETMVRTVEEH